MSDGLHQRYRIVREGDRSTAVQIGELPPEVAEDKILVSVRVDAECDEIYKLKSHGDRFQGTFKELVQYLSDICQGQATPDIKIRKDCRSCEFKTPKGDFSGWHECLETVGVHDPKLRS